MKDKEITQGCRVALLNTDKSVSDLNCDRGVCINIENNYIVWQSDLGGVYRTPKEMMVVEPVSRAI